jgi:chromosome segregation ATPase
MSDGITEAYKNVQTLTHDHKQETPYTKQIWAYLEKVEADNAALREQVKRLSTCGTDHSTPWWQVKCEDLEAQLATLQAQLADRDAMILQMGEQAAVLAKENMAVKAQLREVEGERDHAKKMEAVQKEVADNQTWSGTFSLSRHPAVSGRQTNGGEMMEIDARTHALAALQPERGSL